MRISRLRWMKLLRPWVSRFPGLFYRVALFVGWALWKTRPDIRANIIRNLLPFCDGDVTRARREGVRVCQYVAQYYVDLVTLPRLDLVRFKRENLEFVHGERVSVLSMPRPIVVVSAHSGDAELVIQAVLDHGRRFVVLVEAQRPPEWSRYLLELRSAKGGAFYESDFRGVRATLAALKHGDVLGVMGDRDLQGTGICVTLAGRPVKLPRGPWEIARRTNALVLPAFSIRIRHNRFRLLVGDPLCVDVTDDPDADIREAVLKWSRLLEAHLRQDPGQWLVLEDYWRVHACDGAAG